MRRNSFMIFLLLFCFYSSAFSISKEPNKKKEKAKVCMVLDKAGKDDHGFNQSTYQAFQSALTQHVIDKNSVAIEAKSNESVEQDIRNFTRSKCTVIFAVGVNNAEVVKKLAPKFPDEKFVVIDAKIPGPNVRSIVYREDQGAFLVGYIAGIKTKTHTVGFLGGMDIPVVKRFEVGYAAGVRYANPKNKVLVSYVGVTTDAWNNPSHAEDLANSLYEKGADIIFHAAGGSGYGVFNAAEQFSKRKKSTVFAIGCDINQNGIKPGYVLTSMVKDIEQATFDSIQDVARGKFSATILTYGLKNRGVDWVLDEHNKALFTDKDIAKVNHLRSDVLSGVVEAPDYYQQTQEKKNKECTSQKKNKEPAEKNCKTLEK